MVGVNAGELAWGAAVIWTVGVWAYMLRKILRG
jgi:hypothetical protein